MAVEGDVAALAAAVRRVGDRWTLLIVRALLEGPQRYSDLQRAVDGIAPNILSQRLKQLEADEIVAATPYSERPLRMEYELTPVGKSLADALRQLARWGAEHGDAEAAIRHRLCGTGLETRWWCPTCDRTVSDTDATDLQHL